MFLSMSFNIDLIFFFSTRLQRSTNYLWIRLKRSIRSARKGEYESVTHSYTILHCPTLCEGLNLTFLAACSNSFTSNRQIKLKWGVLQNANNESVNQTLAFPGRSNTNTTQHSFTLIQTVILPCVFKYLVSNLWVNWGLAIKLADAVMLWCTCILKVKPWSWAKYFCSTMNQSKYA